MYAGLRLAKTFECCCPDQLNKRLTDSKIESVRRKLCSVRAKSTFVVASSQSQRVVCARQILLLRSGRDNSTIVFCCCIAIQKTFVGFSRLVYARHKTSVAQCARVKDFCCVVDAITQRSSFVVVLPYKNFCWLQSANVR